MIVMIGHNGRFLILRLYIVVVFARSLAPFATTCTAVHSNKWAVTHCESLWSAYTQRKFVSRICHTHSNAHKPPMPVATTIFMLDKNF